MRLLGVSLGERNLKLGDVMSFSLPSHTTCPGISAWCRKHCYATRYERRRPSCQRAYDANLRLARDTERFVRTMTGVIPRILPCFRTHISGDFFSEDYIDAWHRICAAFPQTQFWAYTRSWAVPEHLPALQRLRSLPNVELFASVDPTMPLPPDGWRVAFIERDVRARGLLCPQQTGQAKSCLACGHCFKLGGDVIFKVH